MRRPDAAATDRNASASTVAGAGVPSYVGCFAPSPTGPLHFGSLIAAMASYADAKSTDGRWLLRIEDLDPPRESPAAAASFPATLEHFGFEWDGPILYQSTREDAYAAALAALIRAGDAFACACTRAELAAAAAGQHQDSGEPVYPGTCRRALPAGRAGRAWRARVDASPVTFVDRIQETLSQNLEASVGDFVVRRADGLWAYQLAVVVDDRDQEVTDVVRGADLLSSTPRQIRLQRLLGAPTPRYAHVPIAVNATGEKLSKQTLAAPLPLAEPQCTLLAAWRFLGQQDPGVDAADVRDFWRWAIPRWDIRRVHGRALPVSGATGVDRL